MPSRRTTAWGYGDGVYNMGNPVAEDVNGMLNRAVRWFVEDRLVVADGRVTVLPAADGTPDSQWLFGEDA